MPNTKPPSGMRDLLSAAVRSRRALVADVQQVFEGFGYQPLETPAMERIEILVGKYAEDGDRLIYRVLKRGQDGAAAEADLGLRYNFTVPLARVVAEHSGEIGNVFKPYQIGPVWRADRPGQGRLRESFHCDVDVVGVSSPMADVEVVLVLCEALRALGLEDMTVALNSRKVLDGLATAYGLPEDLEGNLFAAAARQAQGRSGGIGDAAGTANGEMPGFGLLVEDLRRPDAVSRLRARMEALGAGMEGLAEVDEIMGLATPVMRTGHLQFDPLLARGLDYYTGIVFEIRVTGASGAVALGGRYDDLIGLFAGRHVPACGGSLYMDRIEALLEKSQRRVEPSAQVLVTVWDRGSRAEALRLAAELRERGVGAEVFLGEGNLGRQLRYATQRGIPVTVILGPDEIAQGLVGVKDMRNGAQSHVARSEVVAAVQTALVE